MSDHPDDTGLDGAHAVAPGIKALGDFIKSQRRLAELSQRELARLADLSDAYLSQLERGLHEPSVRVVTGLAHALNVPSELLLKYLGHTMPATLHARPNRSSPPTSGCRRRRSSR